MAEFLGAIKNLVSQKTVLKKSPIFFAKPQQAPYTKRGKIMKP
jgi:hypothetical protein